MATDEWSTLYNHTSHDIVPDGTTSPKLNNHLYKGISLQLTGNSQIIMNAKSHLRGDGVGLFHAIRLTYKTTTNMSFSKKNSQLTGGSHFRARNEDVDTYVARTLTLIKDLNSNG